MSWTVRVKKAALQHLQWLGKKTGRKVLKEALKCLEQDPLTESKKLKVLRANPFAQRELRLFGKYRVLFSIQDQIVSILLVGEKLGNKLLVMGEEFSAHHESDPSE